MQDLLKVLIVDDELMVRVGLSATIQWEEYGFQVIGTCENGEQAVREIERTLPDVLFTDLKMPVMDGFELIQHIRKTDADTKIIVLSCLNEVEAVKNAMKMGADDYILKLSLSADGLKRLLQQLKDTIAERKKENSEVVPLHSGMSDEKNRFYSAILQHGIQDEKEESKFVQYSPGIQECREFFICCCMIDTIQTTETENHSVTSFAVDSIMDEFFQELPFCETLQPHPMKRTVFLGFPDSSPANIEMVQQYWNKIHEVLKTHLNISCTSAISQPFYPFTRLPQAYALVEERLLDCFFIGNGNVLLCKEEPMPKKKIVISTLALSLQTMVNNRNRQGAKDFICNWFRQIQEEFEGYSQYSIKAAVSGVWAFISGYGPLSEQVSSADALGDSDYFNSFFHAKSLEELLQVLLQGVDSLIEIATIAHKIHPEILQLKQYIAEHIEEEITLSMAANRCCLNKTYFCSLFKKEVGETYNEYCERMKMERAKVLLLSNHSKIYEVGLQVGIQNESYFSRRFKKYFGISPGQMRQAES